MPVDGALATLEDLIDAQPLDLSCTVCQHRVSTRVW